MDFSVAEAYHNLAGLLKDEDAIEDAKVTRDALPPVVGCCACRPLSCAPGPSFAELACLLVTSPSGVHVRA